MMQGRTEVKMSQKTRWRETEEYTQCGPLGSMHLCTYACDRIHIYTHIHKEYTHVEHMHIHVHKHTHSKPQKQNHYTVC